MNSNEWPLVLFTLLSQISLGIIFTAFIVSFVLKNTDTPSISELKRLVIIVAMSLMGIALIISFLHLGSPQHAVYALSNTGASWLSREILLAAIFLFTLLVCFTSLSYNIPHRSMFDYFFLASLFTGMVMVWTIARVYMLPTVPLWNTPGTPIAFFNSALLLGSSGLLLMIFLKAIKTGGFPEMQPVESMLFYMTAGAVFIFLLNKMFFMPDVAAVQGGFTAPVIGSWFKITQNLLIIAGFTLITYWYLRHAASITGSFHTSFYLILVATVCFFLAELVGRYIFYASYYRVGV